MTDWQGVGAALLVSALAGGPVYITMWMKYPDLAGTFAFFYVIGTVGLCLIAAGDDDD